MSGLLALPLACGGLDSGRIVVEDESGGTSGSGNGGDPGGGSGNEGGDPSGGTGGTAGSNPSGGSSGSGGTENTDPLQVVTVSPDADSTGVERDETISVEFSRAVDPDTVSAETITVKLDGEAASGTFEVEDATVRFVPDHRYALFGKYTLEVTTGVAAEDGGTLTRPFTSTFTVRDGQWSEPVVISNAEGYLSASYYQGESTVVMDATPDGGALVAWLQQDTADGTSAIFARRYEPGEGWGRPQRVDPGLGGADGSIALDVNDAGQAVVAWTINVDGSDQVYARRFDGSSWEAAPLRVDTSPNGNYLSLSACVTSAGTAIVGWNGANSTMATQYSFYANRAVAGGAWKDSDLYVSGSWVNNPSSLNIMAASDGDAFAAWYANSGAQSVIRAARYVEEQDDWIASPIAGTEESYPSRIELSPAEDGGAVAVWQRDADMLASRYTKAGGWTTATPIDALDVSSSSFGPSLAGNGTSFLAVWTQEPSSVTNAYSADFDGRVWTAPELRTSGDVSVNDYFTALGLGMDPRGNAVVVWPGTVMTTDEQQSQSLSYIRRAGGQWSEVQDAALIILSGFSYTLHEVQAVTAPDGTTFALVLAEYPYEHLEQVLGAVFE